LAFARLFDLVLVVILLVGVEIPFRRGVEFVDLEVRFERRVPLPFFDADVLPVGVIEAALSEPEGLGETDPEPVAELEDDIEVCITLMCGVVLPSTEGEVESLRVGEREPLPLELSRLCPSFSFSLLSLSSLSSPVL